MYNFSHEVLMVEVQIEVEIGAVVVLECLIWVSVKDMMVTEDSIKITGIIVIILLNNLI